MMRKIISKRTLPKGVYRAENFLEFIRERFPEMISTNSKIDMKNGKYSSLEIYIPEKEAIIHIMEMDSKRYGVFTEISVINPGCSGDFANLSRLINSASVKSLETKVT